MVFEVLGQMAEGIPAGGSIQGVGDIDYNGFISRPAGVPRMDTLAVPAMAAWPVGINIAGSLVGNLCDPAATGTGPAFIVAGGAYPTFARPGATATNARAISNAGIVTGFVVTVPGIASYVDLTIPVADPSLAPHKPLWHMAMRGVLRHVVRAAPYSAP